MKLQANRSTPCGRLKATVIYNGAFCFVPSACGTRGEWLIKVVDEKNEVSVYEPDMFYPGDLRDVHHHLTKKIVNAT